VLPGEGQSQGGRLSGLNGRVALQGRSLPLLFHGGEGDRAVTEVEPAVDPVPGLLHLGVLNQVEGWPVAHLAALPGAESDSHQAALAAAVGSGSEEPALLLAGLPDIDIEAAARRPGHSPPLAQQRLERRSAPAPTLLEVAEEGRGGEADLVLACCYHRRVPS